MAALLRVLLVEDSEDDASLVIRELRRGYTVEFQRVDSAQALRQALSHAVFDLVISDYSMPEFSALAALDIVQKFTLELPFIIVSGAVGEDTAVAAMRAGA